MLRKKPFWGLNLAVTTLFFLTACAGGTTPAPAASPATGAQAQPGRPPAGVKQEFTFNNGSEPESLDPAIATDTVSANIIYQLLEGLVVYDGNTLEPKPGMATSWDVSSDGKVYTFKLRDAKWSNGDPFTADDIVYSWLRILNPNVAGGKPSAYAYQLFFIKNAEDYNGGKITDASQVGVKAKDPKTVEVTLQDPVGFFLQAMGHHAYSPVNRNAVEKFGKDWTRPENYVSNGAFKLSEWKDHDHITLVKNPNYWDAQNVFLEKITALPVEDNDTALAQYERNEIEWMRTIPPKAIDQWKGKPDYHNDPALILQYAALNVKRKPLDDVRVRKALSMAIDRKAIVEKILKGGQLPAYTATPPGFDGYNRGAGAVAPKGIQEDVAQAKKLLADAGFPDGKGFPTFTIIYNTNATHKAVYEFVQQEWKQKLGIDVNLENLEFQVKIKRAQQKDYDIARDGWVGDYPDPNTFLGGLFTCNNGNNDPGWCNAKFDDLIKQAVATRDQKQRYKLYADAEKILVEDELPIIPLYFGTNLNLTKPWIKGMTYNLLDIHFLKSVYTEGKK